MYQSQSMIARDLLARVFKQAKNVENSEIPIYVNYSIPYDNIDKRRIIIYDTDTLMPANFLGNKDVIRTQSFSVVVSDLDSQTAYDRANTILEYLEGVAQEGDIVDIDAINDIELMGMNEKKYYLYRCDYILRRLK